MKFLALLFAGLAIIAVMFWLCSCKYESDTKDGHTKASYDTTGFHHESTR